LAATAKKLGAYDILRPIGQGGMGAVFVARHRELGCLRAVKVVSTSDPKRVARFEREVEALARVRHPSVVRVHDTGREGDVLYFAMDLVEGGQTLDAVLKKRPPLGRALELVEGATRGVQALHDAGLIHRDVKPANIVVDRAGTPIVIDLGLAASDDWDRLTKTGAVLGTLQYMAPEQALTQAPPGPANDVYSLGAILYEAITGTTPIEAVTPQELLMALAAREIERPSSRVLDLPEGLDDVCLRALARDPEARYPTASALAVG
jgi:serine/threonine-protein kinase